MILKAHLHHFFEEEKLPLPNPPQTPPALKISFMINAPTPPSTYPKHLPAKTPTPNPNSINSQKNGYKTMGYKKETNYCINMYK